MISTHVHLLTKKVHPDAVHPFKLNDSDVGYDLTIISKAKDFSPIVSLYDTGIQIQVQSGWYAEIIPRSSLCKYGYMMANSVGIIDNEYRGNLYIPLIKIDPNARPIEFPFRCCQLIIRKQEKSIIQNTCDDLDETKRGTGGFGSTG